VDAVRNLIKGQAKLKPIPKSATAAYTKIDNNWREHKIPDNIGWERKQALRKIATINGFGQSVSTQDKKGKKKGHFEFFSDYHKKVYNECLDLFIQYVDKINHMELCFEPLEGLFGDTMVLPYSTRFNSVPKQITLRENYEKAWKGGEKQYTKASFVTLTTDPKKFKNLWESNKHFQENWNKLITRLRKQTKQDLPYVCVREFQKNGRVHFHIAIFGIHLPRTPESAKDKHFISCIWNDYGQGKITDVKNLTLKDGVFQWARHTDKPKDCKRDQSPMSYLKKYLIKAQFDETAQFQYWIYNARYYTYSQSLHKTPKRRRYKALYQYVGTIDREAGKFYRRKGTKGKQNHILARGTLATPKPPPVKEDLPTGFLMALLLENRRKKM